MSDFNPYQPQINLLEKQLKEAQALAQKDEGLKDLVKEEVEKLQKQILELNTLADQFLTTQSNEAPVADNKTSCIMEFRPGTGGEEAKIWADDLMRMYVRFTEMEKLRVSFIDEGVIKISGKILLDIDNKDVFTDVYPYELFRLETGVHRVQRVPETESQGRIHTSTATIAVLPEIPPHAVTIRDEDLIWQFMRSSGAGGQSVNKTNSAVRLTHQPTGLVVTARSERSQAQNRQIALELLRSQIWEIEEEARLKELGQARSGIGRAMRAEKIRTYNYPQNRVTDHRTKQSFYNLEAIMAGNISNMLKELHQAWKE